MLTRPLAAVLAASSLALGLGLPSEAAPNRTREQVTSSSDRAQAALAKVRSIFADHRGARRALPGGRDATVALRDLARLRDELAGAERRQAGAYLARPTDADDGDPYTPEYAPGTPSDRACHVTVAVCVHWVATTEDAPSPVDANANSVPDFVDTTLATVANVHATYAGAGYRPPKSDGTAGGDARTDIYLADIGPLGLYGYCTSDDPELEVRYDVSAYCVLDNDYAADEFPSGTPLDNMRVTAAHEYMHAVQYAYDWLEDAWLMEATATWAEDEVFDSVDDNVQYLSSGPLGEPWVPLDLSVNPNWYGDWIFFRYLGERFTTQTGGMPTIVRDVWRRADAAPGARDDYALQAVKGALAARNASFGKTFAQFADANRRARKVYDEGAANSYPSPPLWGQVTLTPRLRATEWASVRLDHLTAATARFVPSSSMTANTWRLKVQVDLAPRDRGSQAVVTVWKRGGGTSTSVLTLDSGGEGSKSVLFDRDQVSAVELTVVNASDRTSCWQDVNSSYSCLGIPRDDDLAQRLRGMASR